MRRFDRLMIYLLIFGIIGALLFVIPATTILPERVIIQPVVNPYAIAESLGCQEVTRECRQHERQKRLFYRKASTK